MKLTNAQRNVLDSLTQDSSCRLVVRRGKVTIEGARFDTEAINYRTFESLAHHDMIYRQSFDKASRTEIYVISTIGKETMEKIAKEENREIKKSDFIISDAECSSRRKYNRTTLAVARDFAKKQGCSLTKKDDEYRVNIIGGSEETAYYTNDIQDAMDTASTMGETLKANAKEPEPMSHEDWAAGKGCPKHRTHRSGSCHECAMLQPEPLMRNKYGEEVKAHSPVCARCFQRVAIGKLPHSVMQNGLPMNVCDHCLTPEDAPKKEELPSKDSIEAAMRDGMRDGAPFDIVELASEFGITTEQVEMILEGREEPKPRKTLREVAKMAADIHNQHEEGAEMDAGFDAGEFSGPAHDRMADNEVKELAEREGFTLDEVEREMMVMQYNDCTHLGVDNQPAPDAKGCCVHCGARIDFPPIEEESNGRMELQRKLAGITSFLTTPRLVPLGTKLTSVVWVEGEGLFTVEDSIKDYEMLALSKKYPGRQMWLLGNAEVFSSLKDSPEAPKPEEPELYRVKDDRGNLLMLAPMPTIQEVFSIQQPGIERVERETQQGINSLIYFNGRHPKYNYIVISKNN